MNGDTESIFLDCSTVQSSAATAGKIVQNEGSHSILRLKFISEQKQPWLLRGKPDS